MAIAGQRPTRGGVEAAPAQAVLLATHLPASSHHLQQPGLSAASHIPLNVDEEQLVKPGAELGQGVGAEPEG